MRNSTLPLILFALLASGLSNVSFGQSALTLPADWWAMESSPRSGVRVECIAMERAGELRKLGQSLKNRPDSSYSHHFALRV